MAIRDAQAGDLASDLADDLAGDASAITALYNHYIRTSLATFEEDELAASEIASRMAAVRAGGYPWLVDMEGDALRGYAYANILKPRSAYRYCAEVTVYVSPDFGRRGVARGLYDSLLSALADAGVRSAVGIVAIPNPASVALHEAMGFAQVAHLKAAGYKFGQWADVGFWQKALVDDLTAPIEP